MRSPSREMTADTAEIEMTLLAVARVGAASPQDIQLFELRRPDGGDLPEFTAGAHVAVEGPERARCASTRSATIPPSATAIVIAVKRETAGRGGSASMADDVKAGGDAARVRAAQRLSAGRRARPATS